MAQDKKTVLIVDDEVDVAALLQLVLESDDLDVVTALDGPSAIKQVRERCPDLVLLDVAMPGHDGFEVYRKIRAIPSAGTTRVVFLTGLGGGLDSKENQGVRSSRLYFKARRSLYGQTKGKGYAGAWVG